MIPETFIQRSKITIERRIKVRVQICWILLLFTAMYRSIVVKGFCNGASFYKAKSGGKIYEKCSRTITHGSRCLHQCKSKTKELHSSKQRTTWGFGSGILLQSRGMRHTTICLFSTGAEETNGVDTNLRFFAQDHPTFDLLGVKSPLLLKRLQRAGYLRPSAVQSCVWLEFENNPHGDVVIGAETGSGKTLAYLLPLIDDILEMKRSRSDQDQRRLTTYEYARAVVLVPTKELAQQVVRMASQLCTDDDDSSSCIVSSAVVPVVSSAPKAREDVVRLAILPGGLATPNDFRPFREALSQQGGVPIDILVTTPAVLGPWGLSPKNIEFFADVSTLVVDEADMLLDGGYQQHLNNILMGFRRADRISRRQDDAWGDERESIRPLTTQHILAGATIPNYGLKSVDAYILKKFPKVRRVIMDNMHNARHNGLRDETKWIMDHKGEGNAQRLAKLVAMLKGEISQDEELDADMDVDTQLIDLSQDKVMVFLNSVEDVEGVSAALG